MRVFHSNKFRYAGKVDGFHIFESRHENLADKEFVIVERAKLINSDGSYQYYDVDVEVADSTNKHNSSTRRLQLYSDFVQRVRSMHEADDYYTTRSIDDSVQRVCLTQTSQPTHIPKRKDAGGNGPVSTIKVNRRKLVSADV